MDNVIPFDQVLDSQEGTLPNKTPDSPSKAEAIQEPSSNNVIPFESVLGGVTPSGMPEKPPLTPGQGPNGETPGVEAGFLQGLEGQQIFNKLHPEYSQDFPQEKTLTERVFDHPSYYIGYTIGKAAQFAGIGKLVSLVPPISTAINAAGGPSSILGGGIIDAIAGSIASYGDDPNLKKSLEDGVAAGIIGGAFRGLIKAASLGGEESGLDLSSKSLYESASASEEAAPKTAEEYIDAINKGLVRTVSPIGDYAAETLRLLVDGAQSGFHALSHPIGTGFKVAQKLVDIMKGEASLDSAFNFGPDVAAEQEFLQNLLQDGKKGMQDAIAERARQIGRTAPMERLRGMVTASTEGLSPDEAVLQAKVNTLFKDFEGFYSDAIDLERQLLPKIEQYQILSQHVMDQTGGLIDPSYALRLLKDKTTQLFTYLAEDRVPNITSKEMNLASLSSDYRKYLIEEYYNHQKDILDKAKAGLNELKGLPLVQELLNLGKAPMKDSEAVLNVLDAAEDLANDMGIKETHASSLFNAIRTIRNLPQTAPAVREGLARAEKIAISDYKNGQLEDAIDTLETALGIKKAISNALNQPTSLVSVGSLSLANSLSQYSQNLPAIAAYNASRPQQQQRPGVSIVGARSFSLGLTRTPANNLTQNLGDRK